MNKEETLIHNTLKQTNANVNTENVPQTANEFQKEHLTKENHVERPTTSLVSNVDDRTEDVMDDCLLIHSSDPPNENEALCSKLCIVILVIFLNIGMVVAGVVNLYTCAALKQASICLLITGLAGVLFKPIFILKKWQLKQTVVRFLVAAFLIEIVLIAITLYMVCISNPNFDPTSIEYCHKIGYYITIGFITFYCSLLIIGILFTSGICCLIKLCRIEI